MKKIYLTFALILSLITSSFSDGYEGVAAFVSPSVSVQRNWSAGLNVILADYYMMSGVGSSILRGTNLGVDFLFIKPKVVVAPRIGYQFAAGGIIGLCFRASAIDYLHDHAHDIRLLPEIGLDFLSVLNICYGYTIPLGRNTIDLPNHRLTLNINIEVFP